MARPEVGDVYSIEVLNHPILDLITKLLQTVPGRWSPRRVGSIVKIDDPETGMTLAICLLPVEDDEPRGKE